MTLLDKIDLDIKTSLKSRDSLRLNVVRMLKSELKYKQIDLGRELTDDDELIVLSSAAKKRTEAIEEYKKALEILKVWLDTKFEGGRHHRRVKKIREIEKAIHKKIKK